MVGAALHTEEGGFVTLSFGPQAGHEPKGRWPALVVSNDLFNEHTGLVEQVKSVDHAIRRAKFVERAPEDFVADVLVVGQQEEKWRKGSPSCPKSLTPALWMPRFSR
ncbi:MAG TPA: type II toxin-antitoxin system PemK/MazF family toxin [Thermoanaerobaculia bacterium]|jgi:mRNA-degrading endonuclease toxin of MazEF toxin-antitoxin module